MLRIAGEDRPIAGLPLAPDREACCAVEEFRNLNGEDIRIRTRALTTTMFARLLVGDLFIHGIGGAKYDELGDEVIRGFFGVEPPRYLTLSMTAHLGLPTSGATAEQLRMIQADLRDLDWNPDRHLPAPIPTVLEPLVAAKRAALALPVATHRERSARYFAIRRANEALRPVTRARSDSLRPRLDAVEESLRRDQVARSREYPFPIHSVTRLRDVFAEVERLAGPRAIPDGASA